MAFRIVQWTSKTKVCCDQTLPTDIVLCVDPDTVAQQACAEGGETDFPWATINAQLLEFYVLTNDCNPCPVFRYSIRYDDSQLVDNEALTSNDLLGIICAPCLVDFIRATAGNEVAFIENEDGSITVTTQHGCQFTFTPSGISVEDTASVNLTLAGGILSADVNISVDAGNILEAHADGLYVPSDAMDFITAVADTPTVNLGVAAGTLTADVSISVDPGNIIVERFNGLFAENFIETVNDSQSIDLNVLANALNADVIISPQAGNTLQVFFDGLYNPSDVVQGVTNTNTVALSLLANTLSADVIVSPDAGNQLVAQLNGLFVPPTGAAFIESVTDTASVDLTVTGTALSADVEISATGGNAVSIAGDGLLVSKGAGVTVSDSTSINLTATAGDITAVSIISATGGNAISIAGDGLLVNKGAGVTVSDSTSINLTATAGDITAVSIISATSGNQISIAGDGLLVPLGAGITVTDTATVDLTLSSGAISADVNQVAIHTDGWIPATESWSAPSATTITVPTNATLKYAVGDKIRLVQDATTKYFSVTVVAATLLTVTGGTDFTLSGNAITVPHYSHSESPVGFPSFFNYTTTPSGSGGMTWATFTTNIARFWVKQKFAHLLVSLRGTTSGSAAPDLVFTYPLTASGPDNAALSVVGFNGGTRGVAFCINAGSTTAGVVANAALANWALAADTGFTLQGYYPIP